MIVICIITGILLYIFCMILYVDMPRDTTKINGNYEIELEKKWEDFNNLKKG